MFLVYLKSDLSNPLGNFLEISNSLKDKRKSRVYEIFDRLRKFILSGKLQNFRDNKSSNPIIKRSQD